MRSAPKFADRTFVRSDDSRSPSMIRSLAGMTAADGVQEVAAIREELRRNDEHGFG